MHAGAADNLSLVTEAGTYKNDLQKRKGHRDILGNQQSSTGCWWERLLEHEGLFLLALQRMN